MAIVAVSLIATSLIIVYNDASAEYGVAYNESQISAFDKMEAIQNISEQIEERHKEDTTDRKWYDLVGNIMADGLDSLRLTFAGSDAALSMAGDASDHFGLPGGYRAAAYVVVTIIIILGILIAAKIKWNL